MIRLAFERADVGILQEMSRHAFESRGVLIHLSKHLIQSIGPCAERRRGAGEHDGKSETRPHHYGFVKAM